MNKQLRIIKSEPDLLITIPFSLIIILLILLLRLLNIKIRVGFLHNDRIGHFAANTELYLLEKKNSKQKNFDFLYFPRSQSCNSELARIWKRYMVILPRFILRPIDLIIRNFDYLKFLRCGSTCNEDRDVLNLLEKYSPNIEFTNLEETIGIDFLSNMGLGKDDKFICLNVRDDAYLNSEYKSNVDYHNYRNSDINNYIDSIKYLNEQGFFVIRMGSKVNNKVVYKHDKFIDYAYNGIRTEFMDIYLGAKCFFCITTGSGFDAVPYIFRRPILYTNYLPVGYFMTFQKNSMIVPKNHYSNDLGRFLTLNEIISKNLMLSLKSIDFELANTQLIQNSPIDLKNATIDMLNNLNNKAQDEKVNTNFWINYPSNLSNSEGKKLHGKIYSKLSQSFLLKYNNWLN
jgi:putative glycosyltransferase (TIGR04372 family)